MVISKFSLQNYFWRSRHSPEEASRCQKLIGNCTRFAASYSTGTIRRTARVTDNLQLTTTFVTYDLQLMTYDLRLIFKLKSFVVGRWSLVKIICRKLWVVCRQSLVLCAFIPAKSSLQTEALLPARGVA